MVASQSWGDGVRSGVTTRDQVLDEACLGTHERRAKKGRLAIPEGLSTTPAPWAAKRWVCSSVWLTSNTQASLLLSTLSEGQVPA